MVIENSIYDMAERFEPRFHVLVVCRAVVHEYGLRDDDATCLGYVPTSDVHLDEDGFLLEPDFRSYIIW